MKTASGNTTRGRAASARRQAGSLRAKEMTILEAKSVVPSADPPLETSAAATPMTGSTPMTEPMLIIAWTKSTSLTPAVTDADEQVVGAQHDR